MSDPPGPRIGKKPGYEFQTLRSGEIVDVPLKALIFVPRPDRRLMVAVQLAAGASEFGAWTNADLKNAEHKWERYGRFWDKGVETEPLTLTVFTAGERNDCSG